MEIFKHKYDLYYFGETMQLSVKNVEEEVFREFKAQSVREGMKVGDSLSLAMKLWIQRKSKKPRIKALNVTPTKWGKGTEKTSEEIDQILY
jgi:hypothetical protein